MYTVCVACINAEKVRLVLGKMLRAFSGLHMRCGTCPVWRRCGFAFPGTMVAKLHAVGEARV